MYAAEFKINNNRKHFTVGDTVSGIVQVTLPSDDSISAVKLSFRARGSVKFEDFVNIFTKETFVEQTNFYTAVAEIKDSDVAIENVEDATKVSIPFAFEIPTDQNLPSSMTGSNGFIRYFLLVTIKNKFNENVTQFDKELIVHAPFDKDLLVTVGSTVKKVVLLHFGEVSLHASINRKGYASGETLPVHVTVQNQTNATVVPRVTLNQIQIYQSGSQLKITENTIPEGEPISGAQVEPKSKVEQTLNLKIPLNESLSIKSCLITVKYFVHVTLDIPNSNDLGLNLPVVITTQKVIDDLLGKEKTQF